jgi:quercetin dioxygenase-like cupin family protein
MHIGPGGVVVSVLLFFGVVSAQPAPVPADQEPHHHVLLKNDYVEVIRATLAPGESTGYHIHSHDVAGVELSNDTTAEQILGKAEGAASPAHIGDVWAESLPQGRPYTHRVRNAGNSTMDLIDIELLRKPVQPNATSAAPIAAENEEIRVYKWTLAAGASSAMHTHERPYLVVAVTPMHLKMSAPDGRSLSEDVKAGDFHWIDTKVTHALANNGSSDSTIVEFELK